MFACLEIDYGETEDKNSLVVKGGVRKSVVLYEMDFGMNNVIRKKEFEVPEDAHMLIAGISLRYYRSARSIRGAWWLPHRLRRVYDL